MKEWKVSVVKYTDIEALHRANSFTTGHESKMPLHTAYKLKHSPIRTQRFYIYLEDIPLFAASQLVRSHVGVQMYQRTKRPDRGGADFRQVCNFIAGDVFLANDRYFASIEEFGKADEGAENVIRNLESVGLQIKDLPDEFDRYAPTSLMIDCNAEYILTTSEKRLCSVASKETREIWEQVIHELSKVDPDLASFCVKPCISHGGICRERCCGFNKTDLFKKQLETYKKNFI